MTPTPFFCVCDPTLGVIHATAKERSDALTDHQAKGGTITGHVRVIPCSHGLVEEVALKGGGCGAVAWLTVGHGSNEVAVLATEHAADVQEVTDANSPPELCSHHDHDEVQPGHRPVHYSHHTTRTPDAGADPWCETCGAYLRDTRGPSDWAACEPQDGEWGALVWGLGATEEEATRDAAETLRHTEGCYSQEEAAEEAGECRVVRTTARARALLVVRPQGEGCYVQGATLYANDEEG